MCCPGIGRFLAKWATRRFILLWLLYEQCACGCFICMFLWRPEVARSSWIADSELLWLVLVSIRLTISVFGTWAVTARKVKSTRVYYFCLILICAPLTWGLVQMLVLTSCSCESPHFDPITKEPGYDWRQCDVVKSFGDGSMTNTVPYNDLFLPPPATKKPYEPPPKWPKPFVYYESRYMPRSRQAADAVGHGLAEEECTCGGEIFAAKKRTSCRIYFDEEVERMLGWCYLRDQDASMKRCVEQLGQSNIYVDDKGAPWSYALCSDGKEGPMTLKPCKCSGFGLNPDWGLADKMYGSACKMWPVAQKEDYQKFNISRPWCWAGFQTTCADSLNSERFPDNPYITAWARVNPTMNNPFTSLSQYRSSQPCQAEAMEDAVLLCWLAVKGLLVQMAGMTMATFPMAVVIYSFLQSRCSDYLPGEAQFTVDFSSDDSSDAFSSGSDDDVPTALLVSCPANQSLAGTYTITTNMLNGRYSWERSGSAGRSFLYYSSAKKTWFISDVIQDSGRVSAKSSAFLPLDLPWKPSELGLTVQAAASEPSGSGPRPPGRKSLSAARRSIRNASQQQRNRQSAAGSEIEMSSAGALREPLSRGAP
eukprot:TRINITY_DN34409_c0_g1_i1.p1 TRINITY_DN34409_c0_g1~~TRINITY_DN34409_c0_g1_i1.p1  ORF type:complete len:593 (+),score=84.55 TRINITY_DN34409_c0_g1_i1:296-2074(+)